MQRNCATDDSALKIYAEDGGPVSGLDLSPFFRFLPGNADLASFFVRKERRTLIENTKNKCSEQMF